MKNTQNSALFSAIVPAPFGAVGIRTNAGALHELVYLPPQFEPKDPTDSLAEQVSEQVQRYLADADFTFSVDLPQLGSVFQRKVWSAIATIPRGEVRTYGQIAKYIRSAPRAVGQACGANWFPLIIPCHRVTAAGGLGGFAHHESPDGFHSGVKRWLLVHEGVHGY